MNCLRKVIQKYNSMAIPAKASIWYTVCNVLQKGIAFFTVPIYVRILTTEEYGLYTVFQSWRDIIIIFATLNLYCGIFTKAMVDYDDDRDRYTSSMQGLSTLLTIFVFLLYGVAHDFWNAFLEMSTGTIICLFAYYIFFPAFSFWSVRQRVEYKYFSMVIVTLVTSVLVPVLSIWLLYTTDMRENAVIWGFLIVQCLVGAFFYILHFKKSRCIYVKEYWIRAIKFNVPLIPHYLSLIVLGQVDRIMIKEYCGSDKAGIYNLAYQVSMGMNILVGAVNNSLVPWIYEKLKTRNYVVLKMVATKISVGMALVTLGIVMTAPEIIWLMGTSEYLEAMWIVPPVAISVFFTFVYGLFSSVEFYYNATKYVMVASSVGAILNIVLNVIFIPRYGFIAAGYTTMICYFAFMIMHCFFMRSVCKINIEGEKVYNIAFMFCCALLLVGISSICMFIYEMVVIRYSIIFVMLILLWWNKERIQSTFKILK